MSQERPPSALGNLESLGISNVPSVRLSFTFAARSAIAVTHLVPQSRLMGRLEATGLLALI